MTEKKQAMQGENFCKRDVQ